MPLWRSCRAKFQRQETGFPSRHRRPEYPWATTDDVIIKSTDQQWRRTYRLQHMIHANVNLVALHFINQVKVDNCGWKITNTTIQTNTRKSNSTWDVKYCMPLPGQWWFQHMLFYWCKFGENMTNAFQDIVLTSPKSAVSSILCSTVTLTFDLLTPISEAFISVP